MPWALQIIKLVLADRPEESPDCNGNQQQCEGDKQKYDIHDGS